MPIKATNFSFMISDILANTINLIDRYLDDPAWNDTYTGEIRERIIRLRDEAEAIRAVLDKPPPDRSSSNIAPTPTSRQNWIDRMMLDETAFDMSTPYFSKSDLLKRGWSPVLIDRVLGAPDWRSENPHYPGTALMSCWRQDRVVATEDRQEFKERLSRKPGRKTLDK